MVWVAGQMVQSDAARNRASPGPRGRADHAPQAGLSLPLHSEIPQPREAQHHIACDACVCRSAKDPAHAGHRRYGRALADVNLLLRPYFQMTSKGATVKVRASIIAASSAKGHRLAGRSGRLGACRWRCVNTFITNSSPAQTHQFAYILPSSTSANTVSHETTRWMRGASAYTMCPPSSCPLGSKFSAVANIPTHAAMAVGCRYTLLSGRLAIPGAGETILNACCTR